MRNTGLKKKYMDSSQNATTHQEFKESQGKPFVEVGITVPLSPTPRSYTWQSPQIIFFSSIFSM
jgi:hypothetical protein